MSVLLSDEIRKALQSGGPVVALETAVLTQGLPHTLWGEGFGERPPVIESDTPINLAAAKAMTLAVQTAGGIPAWVAVINGSLRIGLSNQEIEELARDNAAGKVSLATIAPVLSQKKSAGTTVATTLQACNLTRPVCGHAIKVFATGGIGGIHRNWSDKLDISADLRALASTQTCVVASGAKSILDISATVESLETLGIPILGLGTKSFPCFVEEKSELDPCINCIDSPEEVAKVCHIHWNELGSSSAVLATCQVPDDVALGRGTLEQVIEQTEQSWATSGDIGATRTPALLDALAHHTRGKSLVANLALLCNNAAMAAEIAVAMQG
ncbi:MAG TPA: pseudouridine-5'-phosphate glycosidase [Phycisphaerales bacterium]|jgi:pseudouridine-5'-phosphate glycosidase|nr:pseudouridine-5'-phosphate glycosidase [Phycisphaerales bacterium]|tara:strand:+ start:1222 stop:2202 length:981 start_codon:yes stop_codon:yes gene_type:complete